MDLDSGAYVIIFHLEKSCNIKIGQLGSFSFMAGYYYYVGSALKNLKKRVDRHCLKQKNCRWHIDYLSTQAKVVETILFRSEQRQECNIADYFLNQPYFQQPVPRFGSSDCRCPSHLFFSRQLPKNLNQDILKSLANTLTYLPAK